MGDPIFFHHATHGFEIGHIEFDKLGLGHFLGTHYLARAHWLGGQISGNDLHARLH